MKPDSYFYDRAEQELEFAQSASHPAAVRAHYLLAGYYLDQFYGPADAGFTDPDRRFDSLTPNIKGR